MTLQPNFDDGTEYAQTLSGLYAPDPYTNGPEPDLSVPDAEGYAIQKHGLAFFKNNPHIHHIWEFRRDEGPLQGLSFEPGLNVIAGSDCYVVSPYVPGKLLIHSPEALRYGSFFVGVSHGVLFDSNMFNRIVKFCESPHTMPTHDADGVKALVAAIVSRGYDYQFMPYVIESYAKNGMQNAYRDALGATRAILSLHTMDNEHFLSSGDVRLDESVLPDYESQFGTSDLDAVAKAQLDCYDGGEIPPMMQLTLLAILKMVLIRRTSKPRGEFESWFAAYDEFLFDGLGRFLGSLRNLGLLYFAGRLDRWIRVQPNSAPAKAYALLENCAWDLYLSSLHKQILADCPLDRPFLYHFCTLESELAQLLCSSKLVMVEVSPEGWMKPYHKIESDLYIDAMGSSAEQSVASANGRLGRFLEKRGSGALAPVGMSRILELLAETKDEFHRAIGRRTTA